MGQNMVRSDVTNTFLRLTEEYSSVPKPLCYVKRAAMGRSLILTRLIDSSAPLFSGTGVRAALDHCLPLIQLLYLPIHKPVDGHTRTKLKVVPPRSWMRREVTML